MLPSSLTSSQRTPAGKQPARRAKSTAASVCPGRVTTPPSRARSGKIWPGLLKSAATERALASVLIVTARSAAEMPVVVPSLASTVTVKAVFIASSLALSSTMSGISSRSRSAPRMPTHTTPLVWRTMKASASGVARSAARIRSPSFSRSSSSRTTTLSPRATAASAAEMVLKPGLLGSSPATGGSPCPAVALTPAASASHTAAAAAAGGDFPGRLIPVLRGLSCASAGEWAA
mmetsp:Transcript_1090/g.2554  ORF Transcript_1090/g.2554 Transcript_1090/m.2554 type:complete len:233 (-) Transcript_1090:317-1015(-)